MLKKKKLRIKYIVVLILIVVNVFVFGNILKSSFASSTDDVISTASPTIYKDFSELTNVDTNYSYSSIAYNENTTMTVVKDTTHGEKPENDNNIYSTHNMDEVGEEIKILVTNCAQNKDGDLLDVVFSAKAVEVPDTAEYGYEKFSSKFHMLNSQMEPVADNSYDYNYEKEYGDLIHIFLEAKEEAILFSVDYYLAGTYDKETDTGEDGKIDKVITFMADFDVPTNESSTLTFLNGDEGIVPLVGSSTIYYNKNYNQNYESSEDYYNILQEEENGIAEKAKNITTDGVWYQSSIIMLTENIENSHFEFEYGGRGCGIFYFFGVPFSFSIPAPTKSVDVEEVTIDDSFTYTVSQYIPNNYFGNVIDFSEIYDNFKADNHIRLFTIEDEIDEHLEIKQSEITVTNETGNDVTSYFDITVSDHTVKATLKCDYFDTSSFYAHTYNLNIPVTLTSATGNLKNIAKVTTQTGKEEEIQEETKEVETKVYYYIKVHHVDINTGDKVAEDVIEEKYYGDEYTTEPATELPEHYTLAKEPDNPSGTITDNVEVTYYYHKEAKLNVKYLELNTENVLAPEVNETVYYGDEYETKSSEDVPKNYELVKKSGDDYTGIVDKDEIKVIYYYQKKDSSLETTITKDGIEEITVLDELVPYTITYNASIKDYIGDATITITDTLPYKINEENSNLDGGIYDSEENTITWIIGLIDINSYEEENEVFNYTITKNIELQYLGIKGEDRLFINKVSGLIELDNNEREIEDDHKVNTREAKLNVKYLEYNTEKELAPEYNETVYWGDEYETYSSSEIPDNYELFKKTDNYAGIVADDEIYVIYYYVKKKSTVENTITKEGIEEITSLDQIVPYTITYNVDIKDYIGDGTITIIDTLPYKINEENSNLDGGIYDSEENTITWIIELTGINTYEEENEVYSYTVTKNIEVQYLDVKVKDESFINYVSGKIELDNNERVIEDDYKTDINVPTGGKTSSKSTNSSANTSIDNPKTGASNKLVWIILLLSGLSIILFKLKKKKYFFKI